MIKYFNINIDQNYDVLSLYVIGQLPYIRILRNRITIIDYFALMDKFLILGMIMISFQSLISQTNVFDIQKISAEVQPDFSTKSISGKINLTFKILKETDSIFLDAKNMNAKLLAEDKDYSIATTSNKIWFTGTFEANHQYQLNFSYTAKPKQSLYIVGFEDDNRNNDQIFTQGQGKYTSHWLPSIDDMNDKIEFDLSIIVPQYYGALANGQLTEQWEENDSLSRWTYDMQKPMSSYLVAFSVGNFIRDIQTSYSGVELHQYLLKKDSTYLEPTYRHTKKYLII